MPNPRWILVASTMLGVGLASAPTAAAEPKVAYVDMARALNEVEDGKSAKKKLKAEFESKQKKLDELQTALKQKSDEFQKRQGMMKADARAKKEQELQRELLQLRETFMALQQELMSNESEITQQIAKKLRKIIAKIGDREQFEMILDIGDTVLYYRRHLDLTEQVVKEYNKTYGSK